MKNKEEILYRRLKEKKIKLTSQRQYIVKLFLKNNHWTIKQIVKKIAEDKQNIPISTLYNTISILLRYGIIVSYSFEKTEHVYELESDIAFHIWFEHDDGRKNYFKEIEPSKTLYKYILNEGKVFVKNDEYVPTHIKIEIHMQKKPIK